MCFLAPTPGSSFSCRLLPTFRRFVTTLTVPPFRAGRIFFSSVGRYGAGAGAGGEGGVIAGVLCWASAVGLGRGCGASLFLGASFPKYHLLDVAMSPPTLADVRCRGLIQRPHATGYAAPTLRAAGESSGTPPYQGAAGCRVLQSTAEYSASPYSAGTFCTVELSGPYWLP